MGRRILARAMLTIPEYALKSTLLDLEVRKDLSDVILPGFSKSVVAAPVCNTAVF